MSFSSQVKEELCRQRLKSGGQRMAELAGLTKACGTLRLGKGGMRLELTSESLPVGKRIVALAESLYTLDTTMALTESDRRKNRPLTRVELSGPQVRGLLLDCGVLKSDGERVSMSPSIRPALIREEELFRAFCRGVFLGAGSVSDPQRAYHLELVARDGEFADELAAQLRLVPLDARRARRKQREILYLRGDDVSAFLALVGAVTGVLSFEDARVTGETRNYYNRRSNCETANIGKTVNAGLSQLEAISVIEKTVGLNSLPQPLYEAARLRMQYPDASLNVLADMAEIGKSGMNHRLSRLMKLAMEQQS